MIARLNLYNNSYSQHEEQTYQEVRREIYGTDLGQSSWDDRGRVHSFFDLLALNDTPTFSRSVAARAAAPSIWQPRSAQRVVGIDTDEHGIDNARKLALSSNVHSLVQFEDIDAAGIVPFTDFPFDAIYALLTKNFEESESRRQRSIAMETEETFLGL